MEIFVSVLESEINSISQTQDQLLENTVSRSGEKPSIVKYTLLCGRHIIPLRDHRNNCSYRRCGNFEALLDSRVEISDNMLKVYFNKYHKFQAALL